MFNRILVVCTANICRSPMGEYLFREKLGMDNGYEVASAGVNALVGKPADENVVAVLEGHGVDASGHVAQQLTASLSASFDLILPAEADHKRWIERNFPMTVGRVQLLGRWKGNMDIPDPYRRGRSAFDSTYDLLDDCVEDWVKRLK